MGIRIGRLTIFTDAGSIECLILWIVIWVNTRPMMEILHSEYSDDFLSPDAVAMSAIERLLKPFSDARVRTFFKISSFFILYTLRTSVRKSQ